MMDFHPQMLWSLFCSLIKVRIVDFGGMVGSHFKLLHKEKNTKVNLTCSHVWLFTLPHILANSVAGITPKLMGTFTKPRLILLMLILNNLMREEI
jgi:hypothetical protein